MNSPRPNSPAWELSTIGDPLLDLGWLLATWPSPEGPTPGSIGLRPWDGFPTADELVQRYAERTTRDLSAIEWYGVLACYKLGIILEGTHARACAGKAPKATGDLLHATTVALFIFFPSGNYDPSPIARVVGSLKSSTSACPMTPMSSRSARSSRRLVSK